MTTDDLARARRLRALDAELANETNDNATLVARLEAVARGDIPNPLETTTMAPNEPLMLRMPQALLDRAEALVPAVEASEVGAALGRVTRAAVLRMAIARGLAELEAEYLGKKRLRRRSK